MAGSGSQPPNTSSNLHSSPMLSSALDCANGRGGLPEPSAANPISAPPPGKKGKNKKAPDPNETGKLLAAKINQLELDAAGDKEQEAEIGGYFLFCG